MNRIRQFDDQLSELTHTTRITQEDPLPSPSTAQGSCHATFMPLHYEPNYAYPLLVWLHGAGDNEQQLRDILPAISVRNYVAVAPRGTWCDESDDGPPRRCTWSQSPEDVLVSEHRVLECVEKTCERFNICSSRIFLVGSDCGGTMALRLAMMHPDLFAGVVSIGGRFPQGNAPLVRLRQARHLEILIEHGRRSTSYREATLCEDLRLLHVAGMSITLRQYPGEDEITSQMLADVDSWIMQQITGTCIDSNEASDLSFYRLN